MRRGVLLFALAISGVTPAQKTGGCPALPASLRAMRDCFRPVLVFAPNAKDANFVHQQRLLDQYADDMMDRDLLYVPVLAARPGFSAPLDAPYVRLQPAEERALRERYKVSPESFAMVLIGKDGGEKYRSSQPVSVLKLDEIVDAMPMRQQEMKDR